MKISVIMSACNQGDYLKETVESAQIGLRGCKDWEILIIDDHSTDGCCEKIKQTDRIRVHKPEQKLGVSWARHLAGEMVDGDIIVTTDTHCYYPNRSLWRMAHWAARQRAIVMPAIDFEQDDGSTKRVIGGAFDLSPRGLRINRPGKLRRWPSLFGSIYLMRRDVWDWLGGWLRLPGYWAGEEQVMSVVAYRFGIPIRVLEHHVCTHRRYRKHSQYPFEMPPHHHAEIAHYTHAACFPQTYNDVWKSMLDRNYGNYVPQTDPTELREWIDRRSVWDEHRFFRTVLGIEDVRNHPIVKFTRGELKAKESSAA